MAKDDKPTHSVTVQIDLRPGGSMGAGADRQAFAARQAKVAEASQPSLTPEQRQQDRLDRLRASIGKDKDQAFNGDRPKEREKATLSEEHAGAKNKGGIEP